MWQQILDIWKSQFLHYGTESIGYLVAGICFSLFYARGTQQRRFHLLGRGCRLLAYGGFIMIILPALKLMNPQFEIPEKNYHILISLVISVATAFLWSSLFVQNLSKKHVWGLVIGLSFIQSLVFIPLAYLFPNLNLEYYLLAFAWLIMGIQFHSLQTAGKASLFNMVGDCLILLCLLYLLRLWHLIPVSGMLPTILFGLLSVAIILAQLRFMQVNCANLDEQLDFEKKRRTLFWDIAPFPILVSKLLDDTILYINPVARDVLKISPEDISSFRLTDYFADSGKRNELVEKVRASHILDSFEVEMRSPRSGENLWLDLSARVVELDGELALYINLHNVTEQKQTEEKLFQQASTDTLTGLYNRRQFETMVGQAIASAKRYQTPYCVMMSDIDHFKAVNDTYGHESGDIVLKEVANLMKKTFRSSDIIGRFGGEEFIVFFTNTNIDGAKVAAENFRQAVEQTPIIAEGRPIQVTISLGLTDSQNHDLMLLTKEADVALYYSKEHGRNQLTVYTSELLNQGTQNQ